MIHRNRKRKHETLVGIEPYRSVPSDNHGPGAHDSGLQSHLATDIEVTRDRLRSLSTSQHISLGALSSLSEACAAVWHDASELDKTSKSFFLFEDRAAPWVDCECSYGQG